MVRLEYLPWSLQKRCRVEGLRGWPGDLLSRSSCQTVLTRFSSLTVSHCSQGGPSQVFFFSQSIAASPISLSDVTCLWVEFRWHLVLALYTNRLITLSQHSWTYNFGSFNCDSVDRKFFYNTTVSLWTIQFEVFFSPLLCSGLAILNIVLSLHYVVHGCLYPCLESSCLVNHFQAYNACQRLI